MYITLLKQCPFAVVPPEIRTASLLYKYLVMIFVTLSTVSETLTVAVMLLISMGWQLVRT